MAGTFSAVTTELDAVNTMLQSIGEAPVSDLDTAAITSAGMAKNTLDSVSRLVQAEGWVWNTLTRKKLLPTTDGHIKVPVNTLSIDTTAESKHIRVVQRGDYLVNPEDGLKEFSGPLTVKIVEALPFDDIPEAGRQYIALVAAQRFQQEALGSAQQDKALQDDIIKARAILGHEEARTGDFNVLKDSHFARAALNRRGVIPRY